MKRLAIYHRGLTKPIIISDDDPVSFNDTLEELKKIFLSDKVYVLKTSKDLLVGRPSDLQAILVSSDIDEDDNIIDEITKIGDKLTPDKIKIESITPETTITPTSTPSKKNVISIVEVPRTNEVDNTQKRKQVSLDEIKGKINKKRGEEEQRLNEMINGYKTATPVDEE